MSHDSDLRLIIALRDLREHVKETGLAQIDAIIEDIEIRLDTGKRPLAVIGYAPTHQVQLCQGDMVASVDVSETEREGFDYPLFSFKGKDLDRACSAAEDWVAVPVRLQNIHQWPDHARPREANGWESRNAYNQEWWDNILKSIPKVQVTDTFQECVGQWALRCFGRDIVMDLTERCDRFLEETLELLQSLGYNRERVPSLLNYVYNRPVGQAPQEVGGVMVTLGALCFTAGLDMHRSAKAELARINHPEVVEKIRTKQASKEGIATPLPTLKKDCKHLNTHGTTTTGGHGHVLQRLRPATLRRRYGFRACSHHGNRKHHRSSRKYHDQRSQ